MEKIPYDKADLQLLRRLQLQMLSYYKMAKHLYMTGPYQAPAKGPPLPAKQG